MQKVCGHFGDENLDDAALAIERLYLSMLASSFQMTNCRHSFAHQLIQVKWTYIESLMHNFTQLCTLVPVTWTALNFPFSRSERH
ncbi:hypothetical protein ACET3Z_019652 [Daucus carota]